MAVGGVYFFPEICFGSKNEEEDGLSGLVTPLPVLSLVAVASVGAIAVFVLLLEIESGETGSASTTGSPSVGTYPLPTTWATTRTTSFGMLSESARTGGHCVEEVRVGAWEEDLERAGDVTTRTVPCTTSGAPEED